MELFAAIRRGPRVDGLSIRELADKHHVHRRTLRQALASAVPPPRRTQARTSPRLEPFKAAIDEMLRGDLGAPKKQRHTARRVLARLVEEHDAVDLSYSTVRDYVAKRADRAWTAGRLVWPVQRCAHLPGSGPAGGQALPGPLRPQDPRGWP